MEKNIDQTLNDFLGKTTNVISPDGSEEKVCDITTGECYVIKTKDGLVERINKQFITEDGRQLLQD
jgi:hypothetical protein